jgi:RHS repeat-associated protein
VVRLQDGAVVQRIDYDEYGVVLSDSNPGFQPFGYAGGIDDREAGLVRFGARDYDPLTGRWLTKDPIGRHGGMNFYAYVGGNPIAYVDLMGLAECDIAIAEELMKDTFPDNPETKYPRKTYFKNLNLNKRPGDNRRVHGITNTLTGSVAFDSDLYSGVLDDASALEFLDTYVHESHHVKEGVNFWGDERYEKWHEYVHQRGKDFSGLLGDEFLSRRRMQKCGCEK